MDKPQKHYAKWKHLEARDHTLNNSTDMKCSEREKFIEIERLEVAWGGRAAGNNTNIILTWVMKCSKTAIW